MFSNSGANKPELGRINCSIYFISIVEGEPKKLIILSILLAWFKVSLPS